MSDKQRLARDLIRGIPGIFHVLLADPEVAAPTCLGANCTTRPGTAFPVMRLEAQTWRYDSLRFCCDDHTADMGYWFDGKSDLAWAVTNAPPYPRADITILGPMGGAFLARLLRTPEHPWVMVRPETIGEVSP